MTHRGIAIQDGGGVGGPGHPAGLVLDDALIGRIEEWVVSTLDDRSKPSGEAEWMNSLDGLTLTKRSAKVREGSSSTPTTTGGWARFRLSRRRGIAVVSLTDQALIKEGDLLELTGDLLALVEAGHRRIVLDFFAVERLSSWAASVIDQAVRRSMMTDGAAIKFSGLQPTVSAIFAMTGLDPRVATYPDSASAIGGIWPDLPALRPLPVSILTALMRSEESRPSSPSQPQTRGGLHIRPTPAAAGMTVEDEPTMIGARLIVQDGPSMGKSVTIKGSKFVIGRGPDCQLRVGSATVSRLHATIERRGEKLFLRDLASTNGTILNGKTLRDREAELNDGDRIGVGKLSFSLMIGPAIARPERTEDLVNCLFRTDELGIAPLSVDHRDATEEFLNINGLLEEVGMKYDVIEGALVVTPLASELDEESDVNALRDALLSLSERRLPKRVVVNLAHIAHLSGRAIGVLVAHHLRLDRSGGALRVCLANPRVAVVLEQVKLGMLMDYHPTVEDAVISAWPQPVSVSNRA